MIQNPVSAFFHSYHKSLRLGVELVHDWLAKIRIQSMSNILVVGRVEVLVGRPGLSWMKIDIMEFIFKFIKIYFIDVSHFLNDPNLFM